MQYNIVAGIGCRRGGRMVAKMWEKEESHNKPNSKSVSDTHFSKRTRRHFISLEFSFQAFFLPPETFSDHLIERWVLSASSQLPSISDRSFSDWGHLESKDCVSLYGSGVEKIHHDVHKNITEGGTAGFHPQESCHELITWSFSLGSPETQNQER